MRFGIWTPLPHTIRPKPIMDRAAAALQTQGGAGADPSFQFAIDVLRKAEGLGFETTLIAERFLGPDLEAWVMAGAIARETSTIEIMPAVHPGIVTPQVVAKMAATLDRISGGRCAINLVNGWWKDEFNLFGNGTWLEREDARYRRMDEFLQVMKGLWTQDEFVLQGEFYRVDAGSNLPTKPCQQPHPPLYTGSRSPAAKDIVARLCDVMFVQVRPEHRRFEENFKLIAADIAEMDRRAQSYGRTLRYGINCHVICADTVEAATAEADGLEANKSDWISGLIAKALGGGLIGTPARIAERIDRYEALGVECLMLTFHPMMEGMQRFASEVMPLLGHGRSHFDTGGNALAARH
jgi:FMNH2-dependent dimethyl sulfone monooxygenase